MKKTISLLLCLCLLVSLAAMLSGCSKTTIIGTWTTTVDYTAEVNKMLLDGSEDLENYFSCPSFPLRLNVQFFDDNTYQLVVDETELSNALATLDEPLRNGITQYFNDMGLDAKTLESLGTGVDVALQVFHDKGIDGQISAAFCVNGTYKLEENTLYLSDHPTNLPDGSSYATVSLTKTELTLKDAKVSFETVPSLAEAINGGLNFTRTENKD